MAEQLTLADLGILNLVDANPGISTDGVRTNTDLSDKRLASVLNSLARAGHLSGSSNAWRITSSGSSELGEVGSGTLGGPTSKGADFL